MLQMKHYMCICVDTKQSEGEAVLKKIFCALAALLLAGCQSTVSSDNPPLVVKQIPLPAAKQAVISEFTERGFKVVRSNGDVVVVEQVLVPNSSERKLHASVSDGIPKGRAVVRFAPVEGGTQITSTYDMILNPGKSNQEMVTLLDSPDGARLQRLLEGIK